MTTHNTQEDADHRHGCQDRPESQGLATPGDGDTAEDASGDEPDAYQEVSPDSPHVPTEVRTVTPEPCAGIGGF
jgi:hypothetical protein